MKEFCRKKDSLTQPSYLQNLPENHQVYLYQFNSVTVVSTSTRGVVMGPISSDTKKLQHIVAKQWHNHRVYY